MKKLLLLLAVFFTGTINTFANFWDDIAEIIDVTADAITDAQIEYERQMFVQNLILVLVVGGILFALATAITKNMKKNDKNKKGENKLNNSAQKAKIAFIAGGVSLVIGLISEGPLWYFGTLVLGIIGLVFMFRKIDSTNGTYNSNTQYSTKDDTELTRECPFCAETIKKNAKICRFCGKEIMS